MNRNITGLILIVLAVGIYFTYTSGQISALGAIQTTNAGYLSAITNAKKLIELRDSVLKQYNGISDQDKARLDKIVPSSIDNVRLMIDISGIAEDHGLTLSGLTTSADTAVTGGNSAASTPAVTNSSTSQNTPSTVTVNFSVTTTYDNFISLLQDLERSLRILDVTHITLTPSNTGIYTYGVALNTYWLNQ